MTNSTTLSPNLRYTPEKALNDRESIGWVAVPEHRGAVYAMRTAFPHGYALKFVSPKEYGNFAALKSFNHDPGLFFWRNVGQVKLYPAHETTYRGLDHCFKDGSDRAFWYPTTSFRNERLVQFEAYSGNEEDLYRHIPSLQKVFGPSHWTFVDQNIEPIRFLNWGKQAKEYWQRTYNETVAKFPSIYQDVMKQTKPMHTIVKQWLLPLLEESGMPEQERDEVINQYIFEQSLHLLRWSNTIDVRDFLDPIARFPHKSAQDRQDMMDEFIRPRPYVYGQMTAEGKITCNPGLRQQD